ncbi:MAG: hypothetical protein WDW38_011566 [Sanguina aurantia]
MIVTPRILSFLYTDQRESIERAGGGAGGNEGGGVELWVNDFLARDFLSVQPLGPQQETTSSYRAAYIAWAAHFGPQYSPFLRRAIKAWSQSRLGQQMMNWQRQKALLGMPLPLPLATIYRLQNGQSLEYDSSHSEESQGSIFHGLFGGYAFYDHIVCVRMLPLSLAAIWTTKFKLRLPAGRTSMIIAANFNFSKMFIVDLASGEILVNKAPQLPLQFVSAAPADSTGLQDSGLRWFEEYGRRLEASVYETSLLDDELPFSTGICLFPLQPPHLVKEVTRGVQVRVTLVYVPERSQSKHLSPGSETGEAVIGKYPLLVPGGPEFVYQSCTYQRADLGSMEGDFRFVEGCIARPTGGEWDVVCPRFRLDIPAHIF